MQLSPGMLFHGRYELIEPLGSGASAEVWKARDTKAGGLMVALKIYSAAPQMDTYGLQDFKREFTTVFDMKHSNLLPPTGYDICQGQPYLVMKYCENGSCAPLAGRMNEEDIVHLLHDVAAGLEYLHEHNIIHQDIKPDNIMLDDDCNYLVTDFGISVDSGFGFSDSCGMSGGTRAYMGPERFDGRTDSSSDIWALGATAVEMLTGSAPWGDHGGILQAAGEPLPELPPLSPEVRALIEGCLEQDPGRRATASYIRRKIDHFRDAGTWTPPCRARALSSPLPRPRALPPAIRCRAPHRHHTAQRHFPHRDEPPRRRERNAGPLLLAHRRAQPHLPLLAHVGQGRPHSRAALRRPAQRAGLRQGQHLRPALRIRRQGPRGEDDIHRGRRPAEVQQRRTGPEALRLRRRQQLDEDNLPRRRRRWLPRRLRHHHRRDGLRQIRQPHQRALLRARRQPGI